MYNVQDAEDVIDWLCTHEMFHDHDFEYLVDTAYRRFREMKIVPPTPDRIERLIKTAIYTYEEQFFQATLKKLRQSITLVGCLLSFIVLSYPVSLMESF